MGFLKKFIHSNFFSAINRTILSLFYKKEYLRGMYFDESRF